MHLRAKLVNDSIAHLEAKVLDMQAKENLDAKKKVQGISAKGEYVRCGRYLLSPKNLS